MRVAVGYEKTVDDIEIGNSSAIGSPMSSRRSQVPFLPPSSRSGFALLPFTDILGHPPQRDLPSRSPSHPRSAIRVRVSAVRLEHVPTFLFFMCTTPRAMGIPSYYLYRRCDFSFPYSPLSFPLPPPVFTSTTTVADSRVPFRHRWVYMGTGYPSKSTRPLHGPYPFSAPHTYIYTHARTRVALTHMYNIRILSFSRSIVVDGP